MRGFTDLCRFDYGTHGRMRAILSNPFQWIYLRGTCGPSSSSLFAILCLSEFNAVQIYTNNPGGTMIFYRVV